MNPWTLTATGLMVWGLVAHLIADWPLQNDWMANNKASLRHPAAWVHGFIHLLAMTLVFGIVPALVLALVHVLIDTRKPVAWWSRLVRQTQPRPVVGNSTVLVDVGTEVRFWTDQVFHIVCIAVAALIVGAIS